MHSGMTSAAVPADPNRYAAPYRTAQAPQLETPRDQPAAVVELEMIANIVAEIHKASERIDKALDRLTGGRPQAVQGSAGTNPPGANSVLSKLIIVREALGQHLADMGDHASRIEKFV